MTTNNHVSDLQASFIEQLEAQGCLNDPAIAAAMRAVPRHVFLPGVPLEDVYCDRGVPTVFNRDGTVLSACPQPSLIATMLSQLRLEAGQNVLEIGSGTGYNAALIQAIVGKTGRVTSVEMDPNIYQIARDNLQRMGIGSQIKLVNADGALGYAPRASYDRIISTAAAWDIPAAWMRQLKPGGLMVVPLWLDALQVSATLRLLPDGELVSDENVPGSFVQLRGPAAGPKLARRVRTSGLMIESNASAQLDTAVLHLLLSDDVEVNFLGERLTANDLWHGFLPYFMLHTPSGYTPALYHLIDNRPVYSLDQPGFALISQGSACFVPFERLGNAICFASADAFIAVQGVLRGWHDAGRPTAADLRLRLVPIAHDVPAQPHSRTYARHDHYLQVWFAVAD